MSPILSLNSNFLDFKLLFNSYQVNSTLVYVLQHFLDPKKDFNGYAPLYGKMNNNYQKKKSNQSPKTKKDEPKLQTNATKNLDTNFINALKEFIINAREKNIHLIFVISPTPYLNKKYMNDRSTKTMMLIANKFNLPFFDFYNDENFIKQFHLFKGPLHLNNEGAMLFSRLLAEKIKK